MSYINSLSEQQLKNVNVLISRFLKWGITNIFTQAAILAIVSKESAFNYAFEKGYGGTANERIRKIFGKRVSHLNDAELSSIKKDTKAFFDLVYGGRYGNASNEGYKYRGGGPNQLTFKDNYEATGKHIGVNLVNNPELVNDPTIAADIACSYFVRRFRLFSSAHQKHYDSKDINDFKTVTDATLAIYHANAGFGKPMYTLSKVQESTGGLKRSVERAPEFVNYILAQESPFKSKEEGDKFRNWVNDNHPEVAKRINLDRSGSHTNAYIMRAWDELKDKYVK